MTHNALRVRPKGHKKLDDMRRVLSLPIDRGLEESEVEALCEMYCERQYFNEGFRLFPIQAHAILSAFENDGGLFPIRVGWGKTLICIKTAADELRYKDTRKIILFIPPEVAGQLMKKDLHWIRERVQLHGMHVMSLAGKSPKKRMAMAKSDRRGLYVMPYSGLSNSDGEELLQEIAPEMILLDEAHRVSRPQAARTRRLQAYLHQSSPKVVALSGTMTSKSLTDFHHLMVAALGLNAPIPITQTRTQDWAAVVDANAQPLPSECEVMMPLLDWAVENFPEEEFEADRRSYRTAYKLRMRSAPGVVASGDEDIGTSQYFINHDIKSTTPRLKELIDQVDEEWLTPSGDEIDFAIHKTAWLRQLSAGFYYEHFWPDCKDPEILARSKFYIEKDNEYKKEMRTWLRDNARRGLDTPMLVASEMTRTGASVVGRDLFEAWSTKHACDFKGRIDRDSRPVHVCDYKNDFAKRWAKTKGHGIIWYFHKAAGMRLHDMIPDSVLCPAGKTGNDQIFETAGKIAIASFSAHGTGKNLQFHSNQLFFQFPREAHIMEQVLGRLHRNGQEADELHLHTMNSTEYDHLAFAAMLNDSLYIHQTGSRQKCIVAGYSPRPRIFPPEVLIERGFHDIKNLSTEDQHMLTDLFSDTPET